MATPQDTRAPSPAPSPEASEPLRLAVLASGTGTNLQALLDTVHGREAEIVAVASNRADAPALERAHAAGVPTAVFECLRVPGESAHERDARRQARDGAMADWLQKRGARLVVLAGYMELISAAFLERFRGAVINVHPSLLPSFPGLRAVEQALDYGVKVFGVTVHFVDAGIDSGPVILQGARELPEARSPEEVMRELRPLEHALLPEAVRLFARDALYLDPEHPRRVAVARTPKG